ncbi:MAG: YlbF family regulator [Bacilli bacterium]|nr:YlbF family regulator [Bacilli bacterium]
MEIHELYNLAYDIADEWKTREEYQEVETALRRLQTDPNGKTLIDRFIRCRNAYETIGKYGNHAPDRDKITSEFIAAKASLYSDPLYVDYRNKLDKFNEITADFSKSIASILDACRISGNIKCDTGGKNG